MSRVQASGTGGAGGGSGTGSVTGIPPTTTNAIVVWANGIATLIKNSLTNMQSSGAIEAQGFITRRNVSGDVVVNADESWIAPSLEISLTGSIVIEDGGEIIIV